MSDSNDISLSIEETNKIREKLGLSLLRTDNEVQVKEQAQVQARLDAEKKKAREKSRKETAEKIKEAKLLAPSKGSVRSSTTTSLGAASKKDADIDDAMAWASKLGEKQVKTQKRVEKQRLKELQESAPKLYGEDDLQGLKVSHRMDDLNHETILVLKDSTIIEDGDQEDELMNVNIADLDQARKSQLLKKGPKKHDPYEEFDRAQMGLDKKILSHYDDPTAGDDEDKGFILGAQGQVNYAHEMRQKEEKKVLGVVPLGGIALDYEKTREMADFYTKEEVLAFKKPKKKSKKTSRKKKSGLDDDLMDPAISADHDMDIADEDTPTTIHASFSNSNKTFDVTTTNFVDDDDLQSLLAKTRQKANCKSNVALRVLEEAAEEAGKIALDESDYDKGLVISDLTEFVGTLSNTSALAVPAAPSIVRDSISIQRAIAATGDHKKEEEDSQILEMEVDQQDRQNEEELEEGEEKEEEDHIDLFEMAKPESKGLAATLSLLLAKGDIKQATSEEKQRDAVERERLEWLAEQRRKDAIEQRRLERERELRREGKKPRMDDWERQQQIQEAERIKAIETVKRFEGYKPNFDITYRDEHGRELDQKQSWKELSQKFHGHKSGKKKTEKKLLKLQEEMKIKNMSSTDATMHSTTLFANQAEKTGSAHLTLSKAGKAVVPEVDLTTLVSGKSNSKPSMSSMKQHLPVTVTANSWTGSVGSSGFGGFNAVEPSVSAATESAVPVSRPKITFGLSTKKGKVGGK